MPTKRPIFRYSLLVLLFAITAAYEIRYLYDLLRDARRDIPVFTTAVGTSRVDFLDADAAKYGLHMGDEIVSVDGRAFLGIGDFFRDVDTARVGHTIAIVVRSPEPGNPSEHTLLFPIAAGHVTFWDILAFTTLYFLLPAICLGLGFWVAFLRPRDRLAWLLLALMLCLPHMFETFKVQGWPPGWREAAMFYHRLLGNMTPIVMFLFGMSFPEPFPAGSGYAEFWKGMLWILAIPYAIFAAASVVVSVIDLDNYRSVSYAQAQLHHFDLPLRIAGYLLVGSFFAAIGSKYGMSRSHDARRRLTLLYWGATIAWSPGLLLIVYGLIRGQQIAQVLPQWLIISALAMLLLFPLTLAYAIVVQKAMGVSVALRQGLQYGLAKNGVRVLQMISLSAVVFAALEILNDPAHGRLLKVGVIVAGIFVGFRIRGLADRLRAGVDRRFFREAYDAEHVLADLSEQVRTMIEPKSLLETVAARISQTLHVPQVAVLLGGGGPYQPAYAMGYSDLAGISFPPGAGTAKLLREQREPARVYLNDRDSWLYRDTDVTEEERGKLGQLGSELLLPLAVRDKLLGFISLGPKQSEEPYTGSDVRLLKSVAAQTGLALENANLMREIANEVAQRERLNREVEIAREVQERLFPQTLPAIAGLDYAGYCRPALGVGGDYYDFLALPQGHLGVAVGDVSGKGIAAALMMASLQASLRGEATRAPENLAAAISSINRLVYEASSANRYATFFYGQYDPATRKFDYVNAGHNPPMLFRCVDGRWDVVRLDVGGTVIGLLPSFPYQQAAIALAPYDILVAYTDGISEAMNAKDEEWGESRLMKTIESCNSFSAQAILDRVFREADSFVNGAKQHDDMTLVVLRVVPT